MDLAFMTLWEAGYFLPPATPRQTEVPKGHCPRCGKHIGRGLHFHVKWCKADDDAR